MKYNNLGRSGLRVSEISFGSWLTFGSNLDQSSVKEFMRFAVNSGINFFDNAEVYAKGESEMMMGEALKEFRREDLVVSTKIYWGGNGPNDTGLSWKHLVEGTRNSLRRMRLSYIDIVFCHRPDPVTPMEETVRAMDYIIKSGYAFYWGTSEWSTAQIREAFRVAEKYNCILPIAEQPQYNLFTRERVEHEYEELYANYGLGLTTWSPLASGILTGKYKDVIPADTRLANNEWLKKERTPERLETVSKLSLIAEELDVSMSQLSIAWCMKNLKVSTVITGASRISQLKENLESVNIKDRLNEDVMTRIDNILNDAEKPD